MPTLYAHGGHCCGRRHIANMNGATVDEIRDVLRRGAALEGNGDGGLLTEIVLSEGENDANSYDRVRDAGFVETLSWVNSNSGNLCTMFVYAPADAEMRLTTGPVQQMVVERAAPAPVVREPAPRVVASTFHNVYRTSGRSDAGWLTLAAAQARPANVIRRDRRDVYASGAVRWVEDV